MREIKFRAWDKKKKKMFEDFDWEWLAISNKWILVRPWYTSLEESEKDIELMQYTWVCDENWKEIYEWDILQVYNNIWIVEYSDTWYSLKYNDWNNIWLYSWHTKEVIWNIYDNPQLYHDTIIKNLPF